MGDLFIACQNNINLLLLSAVLRLIPTTATIAFQETANIVIGSLCSPRFIKKHKYVCSIVHMKTKKAFHVAFLFYMPVQLFSYTLFEYSICRYLRLLIPMLCVAAPVVWCWAIELEVCLKRNKGSIHEYIKGYIYRYLFILDYPINYE